MHCDEFERRMQMLLDRRIQPELDDRLRAHAEFCAGCHKILLSQEALLDGLDLVELPSPPDDFTDRVITQCRAARHRFFPRSPTHRLARPFQWLIAGAVAAALLVGAFYAARTGDTFTPTIVEQPTDDVDQVDGPVNPEGPATRLADDTENRQPNTLAAATVEHGLDYGAATARALADLKSQLPKVGDLLAGADQAQNGSQLTTSVTRGLRPVASSVTSALNVLRRTLPAPKEAQLEKPQARFEPVLDAAANCISVA